MPKKYLLYIHSEQFDTEPEKSGLVNRLLDDYYGKPAVLAKKIKKETIKPKIIKTPTEAKEVVLKVAKKKVENLSVSLCEHFQPKGTCEVKGCKYGRMSQ